MLITPRSVYHARDVQGQKERQLLLTYLRARYELYEGFLPTLVSCFAERRLINVHFSLIQNITAVAVTRLLCAEELLIDALMLGRANTDRPPYYYYREQRNPDKVWHWETFPFAQAVGVGDSGQSAYALVPEEYHEGLEHPEEYRAFAALAGEHPDALGGER